MIRDPISRDLRDKRTCLQSWVDAYKDRVKFYYPKRGKGDARIVIDKDGGKMNMSVDWYNSVDIASFIKKLKKELGVKKV